MLDPFRLVKGKPKGRQSSSGSPKHSHVQRWAALNVWSFFGMLFMSGDTDDGVSERLSEEGSAWAELRIPRNGQARRRCWPFFWRTKPCTCRRERAVEKLIWVLGGFLKRISKNGGVTLGESGLSTCAVVKSALYLMLVGMVMDQETIMIKIPLKGMTLAIATRALAVPCTSV